MIGRMERTLSAAILGAKPFGDSNTEYTGSLCNISITMLGIQIADHLAFLSLLGPTGGVVAPMAMFWRDFNCEQSGDLITSMMGNDSCVSTTLNLHEFPFVQPVDNSCHLGFYADNSCLNEVTAIATGAAVQCYNVGIC